MASPYRERRDVPALSLALAKAPSTALARMAARAASGDNLAATLFTDLVRETVGPLRRPAPAPPGGGDFLVSRLAPDCCRWPAGVTIPRTAGRRHTAGPPALGLPPGRCHRRGWTAPGR